MRSTVEIAADSNVIRSGKFDRKIELIH